MLSCQATADRLGMLTTLLRAAIEDRVAAIVRMLPEDLIMSLAKKHALCVEV